MGKENPFDEARRYLQNAKDLLKNNTTIEDGFYSDSKYVRLAGKTAWKGCLIAIDAAFKVREDKRMIKGSRLQIEDYISAVSKRDHELSVWVKSGYNHMHLYMGYDGEKKVTISESAFSTAKDIIDRCENIAA